LQGGVSFPLHLPWPEIASLRSQRQGMFEIASSPGLLAKTVGVMPRLFHFVRKDSRGSRASYPPAGDRSSPVGR